ncbi:MAG: ATP:cob(I)alamin adenosyltransferase [Patescibacteria group bacterium]
MTIYFTGKGDKGKSAMGARKIAKDDPLFEALGALDELNSWLGFCQDKRLKPIQEDLFIAQAEIVWQQWGKKARPTEWSFGQVK